MPSTTASSFGDIVLVPFPFTDQTGHKKRPAVVVSSRAFIRKLGRLSDHDRDALRQALAAIFG